MTNTQEDDLKKRKIIKKRITSETFKRASLSNLLLAREKLGILLVNYEKEKKEIISEINYWENMLK